MLKKVLLYSFIFYTFFGFVVIPLILKPQLISVVEEQTNAKLEIATLYFNPFMFRLEMQDVKLLSLDKTELINTKTIILNVELYSLFRSAIHVKELIVEEPKILLVLNKDKTINFSSLTKISSQPVEETNTTSEMPRIILDKIAVINGSLNYEDYSKQSKFEFRVDTLGFELKDIDTKNMQTSDARIRVYMKLEDGGFFDLKSEIIALEPFSVQGSLDYKASRLYSEWRYVKDSLNLEVANGKLSLNTQYYFNMDDFQATNLSNFNMSLDSLRVKPKGNYKDILTLKILALKNAYIKPFAQDIHIEEIALDSLDIKIKRDESKIIDWQEYIKINGEPQKKEEVESTTDAKPWNVLVDSLLLEKIKVDFKDKAIQPNVNNTLNELNIYAQNIRLDGTKPLSYQMNLLLNDEFKCKSEGSVIHKVLELKSSTECSGLDIEHFVPYIDEIAQKELKTYNIKLRSLKTDFDANVNITDVNSTLIVDVHDANILLNDFALNKRSTNKRLVTFSDLNISGINLNTQSKEVSVDNTTMKYLHARVKKLQDGSMSIDNLIVPYEGKVIEKKKDTIKEKEKEKDYRIRLNNVALKGSKVSFEDQSMSPKVKAKIDQINLSVQNIDSKENSWMNYDLSAKVNSSGNMKLSGNIRHTPLKQKGKISLARLSLKEITPYLQESAFVSLDDGYVSFKTKMQYAPSKDKADLSVDGSFKLEEIFLSDSRDQSSLVSFSNVNLKEFTLETSPNRLFVNEVDVDAFYINARIDANQSMNFSGLVKNTDANTSENVDVIKKTDANETVEAFPVRVMKVNVNNGSAIFSDASLPIDFKTDIHDLNGVIYAISSNPNETSYIDIVGEINKYGSTKLKGSVNASSPKAFTDLDFNFRNLDLSAMSGYSRTFAGYHIDQGKLFLNLNYDIQDAELKGENSIIVKKIKLGEEVEIDGGSLPLGFVIALLEDSDGIIDIDMPVRGNVDDPDFKYGALVWKTFGNLILKAVASPFNFLGATLGISGDELEYVEFEAACVEFLPSEREKMDNIAKLLIKRPKMNLSIGGGYNELLDKEAMQSKKLIELVVKLSDSKNEKERISAMTVDLLEDIYEDARDDDKLDEIENNLEKEYKGEELQRVYLLALIKECTEIQTVTLEEIKELARKRSQVIKTYLVDSKGIEIHRVSESKIIKSQSDKKKLIRTKLEVIVK